MIERTVNGIPFFQFPRLAAMPQIRHGIFTRRGGCSKAPFDSLNVALSVTDDPEDVRRNRQAVEQVMGDLALYFIRQVHGTDIVVLSQNEKGNAVMDPGPEKFGDAVISDIPGIGLTIQTADCQSVVLYDPVRRAIGNVHCGWRGSIQNIVGKTVAQMAETFGTRPQDLLAGIGPSLGPCCAEFIHYRTEIPETFHRYRVGFNHFDFQAISFDQLQAAGVKGKNIVESRRCTRCRTDLFFSYRAENKTGRFATVIGISP